MIREYRTEDRDALVQLFVETVHQVNARDYTPAQLDAWAPREQDLERWGRTFLHHRTFICQREGQTAGFATLDGDYFDHLFVHKDWQGQGVATELCQAVEGEAKKQGVQQLDVAASITARPFFQHRGYRVLQEQTIERRGCQLTNYKLQKDL